MLTEEQIIAIADDAHDKWNSEADRDNQWDALGHDEIFVLIARAIESAVSASKAAEYAYIRREATNAALEMAAERFDRMTIECGTNATIRCEYASQIIRNLKD